MWASLVAQTIKKLPEMQKSQVRSLGWEDPLKKEMATHSNIPAWKIIMDRGAWRAISPWGHKEWDTAERLTRYVYAVEAMCAIQAIIPW